MLKSKTSKSGRVKRNWYSIVQSQPRSYSPTPNEKHDRYRYLHPAWYRPRPQYMSNWGHIQQSPVVGVITCSHHQQLVRSAPVCTARSWNVRRSTQQVLRAVISSNICYASSGWWGFASAADRQHLKVFTRRSECSRFTPPELPSFADLCCEADDSLFNSHHVLHHLHHRRRRNTTSWSPKNTICNSL